jgi:protein-tyrosine phosphatase
MNEQTDFKSHYIHGYVADGRELNVPLISEVLPGFWQGGCKDGVRLPEDFDLVISLYKWEEYKIGPNTERLTVTAYDSEEVPDVGHLAEIAHREWSQGKKVLVHCQAGLNRSGLVAAQVLMLKGWPAVEAINHLREKRSPLVLCNTAFETWLLEQPSEQQK